MRNIVIIRQVKDHSIEWDRNNHKLEGVVIEDLVETEKEVEKATAEPVVDTFPGLVLHFPNIGLVRTKGSLSHFTGPIGISYSFILICFLLDSQIEIGNIKLYIEGFLLVDVNNGNLKEN